MVENLQTPPDKYISYLHNTEIDSTNIKFVSQNDVRAAIYKINTNFGQLWNIFKSD